MVSPRLWYWYKGHQVWLLSSHFHAQLFLKLMRRNPFLVILCGFCHCSHHQWYLLTCPCASVIAWTLFLLQSSHQRRWSLKVPVRKPIHGGQKTKLHKNCGCIVMLSHITLLQLDFACILELQISLRRGLSRLKLKLNTYVHLWGQWHTIGSPALPCVHKHTPCNALEWGGGDNERMGEDQRVYLCL